MSRKKGGNSTRKHIIHNKSVGRPVVITTPISTREHSNKKKTLKHPKKNLFTRLYNFLNPTKSDEVIFNWEMPPKPYTRRTNSSSERRKIKKLNETMQRDQRGLNATTGKVLFLKKP